MVDEKLSSFHGEEGDYKWLTPAKNLEQNHHTDQKGKESVCNSDQKDIESDGNSSIAQPIPEEYAQRFDSQHAHASATQSSLYDTQYRSTGFNRAFASGTLSYFQDTQFTSSLKRAEETTCIDYFTELYSGIREDDNIALYFNYINIARRIGLILIALYLEKQPWIQTIIFLLQTLFVCVYILGVMPFTSPLQNALEIFNELVILALAYQMCILTGFNVPKQFRQRLGSSANGFIVTLIVANVTYWATYVANYLKLKHLRVTRKKQKRAQSKRLRLIQAKLIQTEEREFTMNRAETERGLIDTGNNRKSIFVEISEASSDKVSEFPKILEQSKDDSLRMANRILKQKEISIGDVDSVMGQQKELENLTGFQEHDLRNETSIRSNYMNHLTAQNSTVDLEDIDINGQRPDYHGRPMSPIMPQATAQAQRPVSQGNAVELPEADDALTIKNTFILPFNSAAARKEIDPTALKQLLKSCKAEKEAQLPKADDILSSIGASKKAKSKFSDVQNFIDEQMMNKANGQGGQSQDLLNEGRIEGKGDEMVSEPVQGKGDVRNAANSQAKPKQALMLPEEPPELMPLKQLPKKPKFLSNK